MALRIENNPKVPVGLSLLLAVQMFCAVFFLTDVIADMGESPESAGFPFHLVIEAIA
ncbi:hypothetical protein [Yoonia sediminilitoris]|nr:hypothetical protein [Yoonia sediminilitoris]